MFKFTTVANFLVIKHELSFLKIPPPTSATPQIFSKTPQSPSSYWLSSYLDAPPNLRGFEDRIWSVKAAHSVSCVFIFNSTHQGNYIYLNDTDKHFYHFATKAATSF